jgi:copper chaperone CopZ
LSLSQQITLNVEGMSCSHCSGTVQKSLEAIEGLSNINVDLKGKKASFTALDQSKVEAAKEAITKAGFVVAK